MRTRLKILLAAIPVLGGCGGLVDSDDAHVRAINAVRGLKSVSISAGASMILEDAAYREWSDYESISSGSETFVELYDFLTGSTADETLSISDGTYNTIYAVGSADNTELTMIAENHTSLSPGYVRLNAVNLSPTQTSVDVYVTSPEESLEDVSPTFSGVAYKKGKTATLSTSTYRIRFTKSGSTKVLADYTMDELSDNDMPRLLLVDSSSTTSIQQVVQLSDNNG